MYNKTFLNTFDSNIKGKFSYLASHIKLMEVRNTQQMLLIDSGLHSNMFNIMCCNAAVERSVLHTQMNHFTSKNLPFAFWIGFENDPLWLEDELLERGLVTDEMEWAMACHLETQASSFGKYPFDIRQISSSGDIQDIISVMNEILPKHEHGAINYFYHTSTSILLSGRSPLIFFICYENNQPVAISSVYYDKELASIFDIIVIPQMRGKGLGKAMTLKAMSDAYTKGFKTCVLTATNDAKFLYQKLGFEDIKTMKVYH